MLQNTIRWTDVLIYIPLLLIWIVIYLVWYMMRNNSYWKDRGVPFVKPKPIFGNTFDILFGRIHFGLFLKNVYEAYPKPYVGIFLCEEPSLIINDIELLKSILLKDFEYFSDKASIINDKIDTICPNIIFFSKTSFWKEERKKVSHLYSPIKIKNQLDRASKIVEQMIHHLKSKIAQGENNFLGKEIADLYSIGTISRVFYGLENNCFKNENAPFMTMFGKVLDFTVILQAIQGICMFAAPTLYKFFRMEFVDSSCTKAFQDITWQLIEKREESGIKCNDIIDYLVERKRKESITDLNSQEAHVIVGHSAQVFLAGFETSGTTIALTMFELARNPECQALARQEVIKAIEKHGRLSFGCVYSMNYLKNCVKETLRLHPALPFLDRRCTKDYRIPGSDLIIHRGQSIFVPVMGIHYDPKYYPNPTKFDPERFSLDNIESRPDLTYLPFGAGPRSCIGQRFGSLNSTLALAGILSNFYIEFPEGGSCNIEYSTGFLLQDKKKIPLKLVMIENKLN